MENFIVKAKGDGVDALFSKIVLLFIVYAVAFGISTVILLTNITSRYIIEIIVEGALVVGLAGFLLKDMLSFYSTRMKGVAVFALAFYAILIAIMFVSLFSLSPILGYLSPEFFLSKFLFFCLYTLKGAIWIAIYSISNKLIVIRTQEGQ